MGASRQPARTGTVKSDGARRASILEVARAAGVAPSSVTRVLGGYPNVSASLRERVMQAVSEVGYKPDLLAAGLRRGYTKTIGVIVSDILNPVVAEMIDIIEEELRVGGYSVLLANSKGESPIDLENLHMLKQRRVDGLIASFADDANEALPGTLAGFGGPVVLLDREVASHEASAVLSDHRQGAAQLAEHLLERGHREIAVISGSTDAYPSRERVAGFVEALRSRGVSIRPDFIRSGRGSEAFGREAVDALFASATPPTALVVGNGNAAAFVGVLEALRERGVTIGRDIALAVAEDGGLARLHSPAITAMRRDIGELGRRAARLILQRIKNDASREHTVMLPMNLVVRESTRMMFAR